MVEMDFIALGLSLALILAGIVVQYYQRSVTRRLQHRFAFLVIAILILSMLPRAIHGLEILFSLGMILFALHLSTYYSGTAQNSGRLYALVLMLAGLVPVLHVSNFLQQQSMLRFLVGLGIWYLLHLLETQISQVKQSRTRVEQSLLWIWFVSAMMSLFQPEIQLLPDLIFILLLLVHIEQAWGRRHIPAPMVILYALLLGWNFHFIFGLKYLGYSIGSLSQNEQRTLVIIVLILFIWRIFQTKSLTKRFMYFWLFQEIVLLYCELSNWFLNVGHFYDLIRFLLFSALTGLFVMIESRASVPLDRKLLAGIGFERRRLTVFMLSIIFLLSLYPLAYWWQTGQHLIPMVLLVLLGGLLLADQTRVSFTPVKRAFRIIRPSLSIWSTVIITLIWGTLVLFDTFING